MKLMENIIIQAAHFAYSKHHGQFREHLFNGLTVPYIRHVIRVAGRVATLSVSTEQMVAAAYLHDVVEDCGVKLETIRFMFGEEVSKLVWELTSKSKQDKLDCAARAIPYRDPGRAAKKKKDAEYLATVSLEAKFIKLVDRIDNLTDTLLNSSPKWALRYADESENLLTVALSGVDSEMEEEMKVLITKIRDKYGSGETSDDIQKN